MIYVHVKNYSADNCVKDTLEKVNIKAVEMVVQMGHDEFLN